MNMLVFVLFCLTNMTSSRLIFVATQFRHGARAPLNLDSSYKDLQNQTWDNPGELTKIGKRMHYLLGRRNAKRYITNEGLLSEKFDPHEILVRSTDVNRTIESALVQLQGLYPYSNETLNDTEKTLAENIGVNITSFKSEINNDKFPDSPIPSGVNTPPIHIFDNTQRIIRTFEIDPCTQTVADQKKENLNLTNIVNIKDKFNQKYGKNMSAFFTSTNVTEYVNVTEYQFLTINTFCDGYFSGKADNRNLSFLKIEGVNDAELKKDCFEVFDANIKDYVFGDTEGAIARIEGSRNFGYILSLMQARIDADINNENISENKLDYSRPKLYMQSAHDSTLGGMEVYIQQTFNESFISPGFAAQGAFEVYTNKLINDTKSENDYNVTYMFSEKLVFNIPFSEFKQKIMGNFWNDTKIYDYCKTKNNFHSK